MEHSSGIGVVRTALFATASTLLFISTVNAADFSAMDTAAQRYSNLKTIQIAHKGDVVWARAYNGADLNEVTNIKSASKSLMSAIVGIAIDKGIIDGVDQSVTSLLPDQMPPSPDPRLNDVTVGHLLSMQAGLERTSGRNYGRWVVSDNWVKTALSRPFVAEPGGRMQYSTGSTHLLSAIIMQASGEHTYRLANRWLSGSGVLVQSWETDPQGIPMGGNQVGMTPASLLALGELYRRDGVTADGRRLLSREWIAESWTPRTQSRYHRGEYGYGWFMQSFDGVKGYYGWGYGGQMIYVLPALELTVAMTSQETLPSGRTGYRDSLHQILSRYIIPAIRAGQ